MHKRVRSSSRRPLILVVMILVVVFASVAYIALAPTPPAKQENIPPTPIYRWNVNFTIQIIKHDNSIVDVPIPGNVGVSGGIWANHTLDNFGVTGTRSPLFTLPKNNASSAAYDGFVHIQPILPGVTYTLRDFFNVWGQSVTDDCLSITGYGDMCTGPGGNLIMEVNKGLTTDIRNHQFRNGEEIWLAYVEQ